MAVSNARPKRRVVSRSNLSPSKYCLIGIASEKTAVRSLSQMISQKGNTCRSDTRPRPKLACIFLSTIPFGQADFGPEKKCNLDHTRGNRSSHGELT